MRVYKEKKNRRELYEDKICC